MLSYPSDRLAERIALRPRVDKLTSVNTTFDHPHDVLRFCEDQPDASLVIVTSVTGGAMRSAGAMMAVSAGRVAGYISNGCVDADIIMRARRGDAGRFVYGEGSPFRDIVLPCGGRIEVHIWSNPDQDLISHAVSALNRRESFTFILNDNFQTVLKPKIRFRIAGRGDALMSLYRLATISGLDVVIQSPDEFDGDYMPLVDPSNVPEIDDDARTAVILLFHDHDWEPEILKQAVEGTAFFVGAMGSVRTHALRCDRLAALGVSGELIEAIRGPIGLLPAMRDANLLAVSILAEVLQVAQSEGML